jgi:hypothetical protein
MSSVPGDGPTGGWSFAWVVLVVVVVFIIVVLPEDEFGESHGRVVGAILSTFVRTRHGGGTGHIETAAGTIMIEM